MPDLAYNLFWISAICGTWILAMVRFGIGADWWGDRRKR